MGIPRVLDHSVRISRFLDNVSNYFENLNKPSEFLADAEQHLSTCGRSVYHWLKIYWLKREEKILEHQNWKPCFNDHHTALGDNWLLVYSIGTRPNIN
ncbi:hypothetical protein Tsp_04742, partial [Trichinella spiralis]|uniref:hypothetical protein n=1 Tax=Trichinella spiralis TaxID=6334 RepID=UPI0001EFDBE4